MKKAIIKWLVRKFANAERLKAAIHAANADLAKKEAGERATKVMEYGNDATATVNIYIAAYGNDGKIDETELWAINAQCDRMVDKYLSDEKINLCIDKILG